ncbi:MAG: YjjG family noncanonical pyrimidine nucleotidase [Clostridia bacterium]|nr:YjjG family noncanonical pyrimidine nucleotidase [Clostridia bacterium]
MIKNILFDLDDTLFDFHLAEKIALKKTFEALGIEPTEALISTYSEINKEQWRLLEQGKITRDALKTRRYRLLFDQFGLNASESEAAKTYEVLLGIGHHYIDGAHELLEELHGKYDLYIVSNGTTCVQKGRIASSDIENYVKGIFISQEIGVNKPAKEFFDFCFAHMENAAKEESVIIGDSLTSDILGGFNAGITTVWFNPHAKENKGNIRPDYEVRSLAEIPALIEKISADKEGKAS